MISQGQLILHYGDYCAVLNTQQKFLNSMYMSVSIFMSMYCQFPFCFRFGVHVCFRVRFSINFQGPLQGGAET
jgi:hypothetical protein